MKSKAIKRAVGIFLEVNNGKTKWDGDEKKKQLGKEYMAVELLKKRMLRLRKTGHCTDLKICENDEDEVDKCIKQHPSNVVINWTTIEKIFPELMEVKK